MGIAGLLGSGRTELLNALCGIDRITEGEIVIDGTKRHITSPTDAINAKIVLVPENRREQGLVMDFSIVDNVVMAILDRIKKRALIDKRKATEITQQYMDKMHIKSRGIWQVVRFLSGGNQQKVVVSKCFATDSHILLLDDPTFGVDIKAKQEIMEIIRAFADSGNGVIFISSEFKEIANFCDSIYIMKHGTVTEHITRTISEDDLLYHVQ